MQPPRPEVRIDVRAICNRGVRRKPVIRMMPLVRHFFTRNLLPNGATGLTIQTNKCELVRIGRLFRTHSAPRSAWTPLPWWRSILSRNRGSEGRKTCRERCLGFLCRTDRCLNKYLIVPDDRSGSAAARNFHLPLNIVRFAPGCGRASRRRYTGIERAAPVGPIRVGRETNRGNEQTCCNHEPPRREKAFNHAAIHSARP